MRDDLLWTIFLVALPLSFLSIGGGASVIAPLQHEAVEARHWMTQREFVDFFAISRASPGPGSMVVTLVGWKVGGWWGALAATVGIFIPSAVVYYGAASAWNRYRGLAFHRALEKALAPIAMGLITAGAVAVLQTSETGVGGYLIALAATLILLWRSIHPLWILLLGGLANVALMRLLA